MPISRHLKDASHLKLSDAILGSARARRRSPSACPGAKNKLPLGQSVPYGMKDLMYDLSTAYLAVEAQHFGYYSSIYFF